MKSFVGLLIGACCISAVLGGSSSSSEEDYGLRFDTQRFSSDVRYFRERSLNYVRSRAEFWRATDLGITTGNGIVNGNGVVTGNGNIIDSNRRKCILTAADNYTSKSTMYIESLYSKHYADSQTVERLVNTFDSYKSQSGKKDKKKDKKKNRKARKAEYIRLRDQIRSYETQLRDSERRLQLYLENADRQFRVDLSNCHARNFYY